MERFMGNKHLRTQNKILRKLNDTDFYVTKPFSAQCEFDYLVYNVNEGNYISFAFGLNVKSARQSVMFNGKKYNDVGELLLAVDEFNKTRLFPASYYDPQYNIQYASESKISWYLTEMLGFKNSPRSFGMQRVFVKHDLYGQGISTIGIATKEDGSGDVMRTCTDNSWISNDFENADDAVEKINGILSLELSSNVSASLDSLEKINKVGINVNGTKKTVVDKRMNIFTIDYKEKIINELESILQKLKQEN